MLTNTAIAISAAAPAPSVRAKRIPVIPPTVERNRDSGSRPKAFAAAEESENTTRAHKVTAAGGSTAANIITTPAVPTVPFTTAAEAASVR